MRTAPVLPYGGGLTEETPPRTETLPGQRPSFLDRDPHVNRITDRCKNITFQKLPLGVVNIK